LRHVLVSHGIALERLAIDGDAVLGMLTLRRIKTTGSNGFALDTRPANGYPLFVFCFLKPYPLALF
jgi:hypothetical protein